MANKGIESGTGKVGMKVKTEDGTGVIEKVLSPDNVLVKLDSGSKFKGDLENMQEIK